MKKSFQLAEEDLLLFRQTVVGAKLLPQDRIRPSPPQRTTPRRFIQEHVDSSFYFSDEFQPRLHEEGPPRYRRPDVSAYELKKLRRGDYMPEFFLDLHGLTQREAKQELCSLIAVCRREHICCAGIMHGHGKHILKRKTPLWLAQHPDVKCFHQAPKPFGGSAALLLLLEWTS